MVVVFLLALLVGGQDKIIYEPGVKLGWDDFRGHARKEGALSSTAISYDIEVRENICKVKVYSIFYKKDSYAVKPKSSYVLNHEQRHFDITYIFARKFERMVVGKTEQEIKVIYDRIIKEWDAEQDRYDSETDNSIDTDKQAAWDAKIDNELKR